MQNGRASVALNLISSTECKTFARCVCDYGKSNDEY